MKELDVGQQSHRGEQKISHVASQQLDLEGDHRLANPDQGEDAGEDQVALSAARTQGEKDA